MLLGTLSPSRMSPDLSILRARLSMRCAVVASTFTEQEECYFHTSLTRLPFKWQIDQHFGQEAVTMQTCCLLWKRTEADYTGKWENGNPRSNIYNTTNINTNPSKIQTARNKGVRTQAARSDPETMLRHCSCATTGSSAPALSEQDDGGCGVETRKRRMECLSPSFSSSSRTSPSTTALLWGSPPHDIRGKASEDAAWRKVCHPISFPPAAPQVNSKKGKPHQLCWNIDVPNAYVNCFCYTCWYSAWHYS